MAFKKGDPNINRNGRPKNSEIDKLRAALKEEGERRGADFWNQVAKYAFTNDKIMLAIVKKFIPDLNYFEGEITFNKTPDVLIDGKPLEYDIGNRIAGYTKEASPASD